MELQVTAQNGDALYIDLVWVDGYLLATTRYGGAISSWSDDLALIDSYAHSQPDISGVTPDLVYLPLSNGPAIMIGGGVSGTIEILSLTDTGAFSLVADLGTQDWADDLSTATATVLGNGQIGIYGGFYTNEGLGRLRITTDADLTFSRSYVDQTRTFTQNMTAATTRHRRPPTFAWRPCRAPAA